MASPVAESDEQINFDKSWDSPDEEFEESPQELDPTSSYPSDPPIEKAEEVPSETKPPETPAGEGKEGAGGTTPKEESTPPAEGTPPLKRVRKLQRVPTLPKVRTKVLTSQRPSSSSLKL